MFDPLWTFSRTIDVLIVSTLGLRIGIASAFYRKGSLLCNLFHTNHELKVTFLLLPFDVMVLSFFDGFPIMNIQCNFCNDFDDSCDCILYKERGKSS